MRQLGSMMGSGGLIVMDEGTCIVDMARYFISFAKSESCGNCTPCRTGTRVLMSTLEKITRGEGEPKDLAILRKTADTMVKTALCGLGQAAANPVTSSLRYFLAGIRNPHRGEILPGRGLRRIYLSTASCRNAAAAAGCASMFAGWKLSRVKDAAPHILDVSKCIQCHSCVRVCARNAIIGVPVPAETMQSLTSEALL